MNKRFCLIVVIPGFVSLAAACSSSSASSSPTKDDTPAKTSNPGLPSDGGSDADASTTSTDGGGTTTCEPYDLQAGGEPCRTCYNTMCKAQVCACEAAGPYDGGLHSQCWDYVVCTIGGIGASGLTLAEAEKYCASGQSGETYTSEETAAGDAFQACVMEGPCKHACTGG